MSSACEIREEHEGALAALTPTQRRALERLRKAKARSAFNHRHPAENLQAIFEEEAKDSV